MSHKVMEITTRENYIIEATFLGGEKKQYDVKQLFLRLWTSSSLHESSPVLSLSASALLWVFRRHSATVYGQMLRFSEWTSLHSLTS